MFLWGAATSSHQIEGYNDKNDWWDWECSGAVEGGARSGAATDHRNRFREDIRLAAELKLNSYRFSIEWSRLEPEPGLWDQSAFGWYLDLVAECERHGIVPMATLHHFTLPRWLAKRGGFASPDAATCFANYTRQVARVLGSKIPLWCTINEPMVLVVGSYIGKFMPPGTYDPPKAAAACENLLRAHVLAYDILHSEISGSVQVGLAHNLLDFFPDRRWHPIEQILTQLFHRFYNKSWLEAVTGRKQRFSIPGLIPKTPQVREALGRKTADFIGVNYYTKAFLQWKPRDAALTLQEFPLGVSFARRKEPVSDLGWSFHPRGLRRTLDFVANYGLPIYITENGIADRDDRHRSDYLHSHVEEMEKAMRSGLDIRGYYHWSLLDNFEWSKGFGPRFGLYKVNYETFERTPTASALAYRKLIQAKSL